MTEVLYLDERFDLAFLKSPEIHRFGQAILGDSLHVAAGQKVSAIGHLFGTDFCYTEGLLTNVGYVHHSIRYLKHNAELDPGYSGGPLIDENGVIIGLNTFIIKQEQIEAFALPSNIITQSLKEFSKKGGTRAARCVSCQNIVLESECTTNDCHICGSSVRFIRNVDGYEPLGVKRTIESLIVELGYDAPLTRRGPNQWDIHQGSARITLAYHEKSGLIIGEAYLCELPGEKNDKIYRYLLQQNADLEGLTFSVKDKDIVLSVLIYDQFLVEETGKMLLKNLFDKSDDYDNVLVERFGAKWKTSS